MSEYARHCKRHAVYTVTRYKVMSEFSSVQNEPRATILTTDIAVCTALMPINQVNFGTKRHRLQTAINFTNRPVFPETFRILAS